MTRHSTFALLAVILLAKLPAPTLAAGEPGIPEERLGRAVEDFALRDYRGKLHRLSDYKNDKVVVVVFLGTECPLVKVYGPRLGDLSREFADRGVQFLGVNANAQDSLTEVAAYARVHEIPFPILKDPDSRLADTMGAVRTPEAFVLDAKRVVRYWGRIDDQFGVGYQLPKAKHRDVAEAVEALLAGKPVSHAHSASVGCHIGRLPRTEPRGDITYSNQIARILQKRCVECHRQGQIAPFPLTDYREIVGWAEMIHEVVDEGRMPPWLASPKHGQFANSAQMPAEEKRLVFQWIENGCPQGNPADLPPLLEFAKGWRISQPDHEFNVTDEPFAVPAEGVVDYKYFVIDPGFKEDVWVKAAEARPGNPAVVHHMLVFVQEPKSRFGFRRRGGLVGYAPGSPPRVYPQGVARRVPAGSRFVVQMHYTPNGSRQEDQSNFGFVLSKPEEVKYEARGGMAANLSFEIPPGAVAHEINSRYRFRREALLLTLTPHMHLRGKAFRYEAVYPDGTSEILLDVPRYDFNWQLRYDLAEPKRMPAGTWLRCTAKFDNSAENLSNPDPEAAVRWGDQTWQEMMIGFFTAMRLKEEPAAGSSGD